MSRIFFISILINLKYFESRHQIIINVLEVREMSIYIRIGLLKSLLLHKHNYLLLYSVKIINA